MKRPALQNKRIGVLRMAFRDFEKRAPVLKSAPYTEFFVGWSGPDGCPLLRLNESLLNYMDREILAR